ncbi:Uncharacterised protein [[Clostridium] sordellii]|uniref:hypothetical protein n=1 Tax=Paraclostridium sordellii TaxID=1505 RepID=UPI0005E965DD|nr:hypothetical protein [Paeniclostridium sordellii]CEN29788.1 Uncharacterised protein [[Clostridium] sordellii] [Paeniclostridium sordellii]CEN30344.1 Uncharacterised protein [[Clostridium] sordellii] [Paeniclostridium sordellii]CEQ19648.1 Uncharacterised protein [[Clostridium] sordellii] [Paeniclostridium sordellii]
MLKLLVIAILSFLASTFMFFKLNVYTCKNENSKHVLRIKLNSKVKCNKVV